MFRFKTMLIVPTIVGIAMILAQTTPAWARRPDMVLVCHFDEETGEQSLISVHPRGAEAHATNHPNDTFPQDAEQAAECDGSKVLVCHHAGPPGAPVQMFTLLLDEEDADEYLAEHPDRQGPCSNNNVASAE